MILAEKCRVCVTLLLDLTIQFTVEQLLRPFRVSLLQSTNQLGIWEQMTPWLALWTIVWKMERSGDFSSSRPCYCGIVILFGCCVAPCVRGPIQKLIGTALSSPNILSHNNLQLMETSECENSICCLDVKTRMKMYHQEEGVVRNSLFYQRMLVCQGPVFYKLPQF